MNRDWRPRNSSTGAVCVTVASCYSVWALTWMQFVTAVWHGLPLITADYWSLQYHAHNGLEARKAEFPDEPPERWEWDRGHRRFLKMRAILESVGGMEERTTGEATTILSEACAARQGEIIEMLHQHEALTREDVGVIPWKEAVWDPETEEWVFRVFYGLVGHVEARLPNWAVEPRLTVHNTADQIPWSEVLTWRR